MRRMVLLAICGFSFLGASGGQALAGTVKGTVTPVQWAQEVEVCLAEAVPSERCVAPGADRSYSFAGLKGTLRLEFIPSYRSRLLTQYYDHTGSLSEATPITLPEREAEVKEGIDADLVEGGAISGTVTGTPGPGPLAEVEVCAVSLEAAATKVCDRTDMAGAYELHSLPGGSYSVRFSGEGPSAEYAPLHHAPVTVTAGYTTTGIDAELTKGTRIEGGITAAAGGASLGGIGVCLFVQSASRPARCTFSDEAGRYLFQGLPDDSYQVGFSLEAAESGFEGVAADRFESQFYDGVGTRAMATTISVLAPTVIGGVDAALRTPPAPPPSMAAPAVAAATVPAPATITAPARKKAECKAPKRKRNVKVKASCVKPAGHKNRKHHKPRRKKSPHGEQDGKR
jgi:Carboxypeptidase regulatory-like domain